MPNPTAAMLVIGDEILSGRTRDANMHHLARELTRTGIDLAEVRVVHDDAAAIVAAVRALSGAYDTVFTSGGIGPTHDDITAEAVARAFDTPIGIRDDARAILAAHYEARGQELNAARLRMARIPDHLHGPEGELLRLVDVEMRYAYQIGTASPAFNAAELVYLPFPASLVRERATMNFVYVSLRSRRDVDLREMVSILKGREERAGH